MERIIIDKQSTPQVLEERITIYIDPNEANKYFTLLKKTWPDTRVEHKRYG